MQPGHDLQQLADRIRASGGAGGAPPYVLVLGERCARAARVPTLDELRATHGNAIDQPELLESVVVSTPIPPFYLDIANLARAGMFPTVIVTGYDWLLEGALTTTGLRQGDQYAVYDLHEADPAGVRPAPIRIARAWGLKGDADAGAGRIDAAVGSEGSPRRLVVVGYGDESPALDAWIRGSDVAELWWVHEDESPDRVLQGARSFPEVAPITGPESEPATLFGQLALVLLRIPAVDALEIGAPSEERGDDWYDAQLNQSRLYTAKTVRRGLESSGAGPDSVAQKQLSYQHDEINRLEQRLTSSRVEALRQRWIDTAGQLEAVRAGDPAAVDQDTLDLVASTINALEREAAKPAPSKAIVAAAEASLDALHASLGLRPPAAAS